MVQRREGRESGEEHGCFGVVGLRKIFRSTRKPVRDIYSVNFDDFGLVKSVSEDLEAEL